MSIFEPPDSLQLPKKAARHRWLASDCLLCGAAAGGELLCEPCEGMLPRVQNACVRCALPLAAGDVCGACLKTPPSFEGAIAAFAYRFPLDALMQRFKYGGDLAIGRWLGRELAARVEGEARPHLLVAPPITRARLLERGFNPALELAKVAASRVDLRCSLHAVRRRHENGPQAGLSRRARLANLREAFECRENLRGLDVAVVDDVLTTGATVEAMARALKQAGAARVRVWTVARTPEPGGDV